MAENIGQTIENGLEKIRESVVIENLEPNEKSLQFLTPEIINEHVARYNFAVREFLKDGNIKPDRILNLGSARGYGGEILRQGLEKAGTEVIGLELGFGYIKDEQIKYTDAKGNQINASAGKIPLANESVAGIAAFEIFEHLPEEPLPDKPNLGGQKTLLEEAHRVLEKDGLLIVSVPHPYSFVEGTDKRTGVSSNSHHLHEPSVEELTGLLEEKGFRIEGEYGQIPVDRKKLEGVKKISKYVPLLPLWTWKKGRDTAVRPKIEDPNQVAMTHVLVARKIG